MPEGVIEVLVTARPRAGPAQHQLGPCRRWSEDAGDGGSRRRTDRVEAILCRDLGQDVVDRPSIHQQRGGERFAGCVQPAVNATVPDAGARVVASGSLPTGLSGESLCSATGHRRAGSLWRQGSVTGLCRRRSSARLGFSRCQKAVTGSRERPRGCRCSDAKSWCSSWTATAHPGSSPDSAGHTGHGAPARWHPRRRHLIDGKQYGASHEGHFSAAQACSSAL